MRKGVVNTMSTQVVEGCISVASNGSGRGIEREEHRDGFE